VLLLAVSGSVEGWGGASRDFRKCVIAAISPGRAFKVVNRVGGHHRAATVFLSAPLPIAA
jgi:hypothetical protein